MSYKTQNQIGLNMSLDQGSVKVQEVKTFQRKGSAQESALSVGVVLLKSFFFI